MEMADWIDKFTNKFYLNFIKDDRWQYITRGLWTTIRITVFAVLLGIAIGFLVAIIRSTHDKTGKLKIANFICRVYLTVIRGTPVVVQLLIIYFGIFASVNISKMIVAVIAFGINSGAYVAEIVRSGIMSIDKGQFEAGRSLGFNYVQTMVSGYIAMEDLTKGGDIIRSRTYDAMMPLLAVALIYLIIVMLLEFAVGKLERRLRNSDH